MAHPFRRIGRRRLVFAHRGGAGLAPENTIAAFDAGLASGADGLELDVRLSADGVPVVHHDARLDRTTSLSGLVASFSARQLANADAGCRFEVDGTYPFRGQGIGVPVLATVLERYRETLLAIELKEASDSLVDAVLALVRHADAADRVCIGSFSHRALRRVRAIAPELPTSASGIEVRWAVYRSRCRWPVKQAHYAAYLVPEQSRGTRVVSARFVADAHKAEIPVHVWTVNHQADGQRLIDWGVDGLITDRPDVIVPLVAHSQSIRP